MTGQAARKMVRLEYNAMKLFAQQMGSADHLYEELKKLGQASLAHKLGLPNPKFGAWNSDVTAKKIVDEFIADAGYTLKKTPPSEPMLLLPQFIDGLKTSEIPYLRVAL